MKITDKTNRKDLLESGVHTLKLEAKTLESAAKKLGDNFCAAVEAIMQCQGRVVCTGLGKSGHIARKIASTLASTGTPALYLHPAEALHGDLGMLTESDVLLAIAYGGETGEVNDVAKYARRIGICIVAITGNADANLAKLSHVVLDSSVDEEACPLNLAPTCSSTLALALGDALAVALIKARGFASADFAKFHPAGSLGRKLLLVKDIMRPKEDLRTVSEDADINEVLDRITNPNFGIIPVVGKKGELVGCVTDGDIRRAIKKYGEKAVQKKAKDLMTNQPKTISSEALAIEAFKLMQGAKITRIFVVSSQAPKEALGLVTMQDLLDAKIM